MIVVKLYIICKSSRAEDLPYAGPTCELAGIPSGIFYFTKGTAEKDARLLNKHNSVGFEVREVLLPNTRL